MHAGTQTASIRRNAGVLSKGGEQQSPKTASHISSLEKEDLQKNRYIFVIIAFEPQTRQKSYTY